MTFMNGEAELTLLRYRGGRGGTYGREGVYFNIAPYKLILGANPGPGKILWAFHEGCPPKIGIFRRAESPFHRK